jgi:WD40 repeat protein
VCAFFLTKDSQHWPVTVDGSKVSADGGLLASGCSNDSTIRIWDLALDPSGSCQRTLEIETK